MSRVPNMELLFNNVLSICIAQSWKNHSSQTTHSSLTFDMQISEIQVDPHYPWEGPFLEPPQILKFTSIQTHGLEPPSPSEPH